MNVLLLGSGGREHAIAAALSPSPLLTTLVIAPGNPGTAALGVNAEVTLGDHDALLALAARHAIDLVVVGPEAPLVDGFADRARAAGLAVFGPSQAASRLEGSKTFTKDFCREFGIPTAAYASFDEASGARAYALAGRFPVVIKADGLAAGKGVVVAASPAEAEEAIEAIFGGRFGTAGARVVIEQFLDGEELSFFALCDGTRAVPFGSAQDHKRVGDGDIGPNTGGMGAVSPAPLMSPELEAEIMARIVDPTVRGMAARGTPFQGVLFAGVMIGPQGPQLIEYNVRFGDPEAEALLLRYEGDLLALMAACAEGRSLLPRRGFGDTTAVAIVLAAAGYPEAPRTGTRIGKLEAASAVPGVQIFHAGTRQDGPDLVSAGGRVLVVVGSGATATEAQRQAYRAVALVDWPGGFCRRDIGWRAVAREQSNR